MKLTEQDITLWGNDIPWLAGLREKGMRAFTATGLPTAKTEAWKYSFNAVGNMDNLQIDTAPHECNGHCHHSEELPFAAYYIDFCNGKLHGEHFDLPRGVSVKPLVEAIYDGDAKPYLNKSFAVEKFPFAALNTACLEQGAMIVVERNTVLDKPIVIRYHAHKSQNLFCNIRNIIALEARAKAEIIEYIDIEESTCFHNAVNEIFLAADSTLKHYKLQKEGKTKYVSLNSVQQRSNSRYKCFVLQKENALARHESYINLLQEGACAEVDGAYRLNESGVSDITTNIRHLAPHTTSNQLIKGVVAGKAKGVFQGQIHIAPDAQQTEGHQLHRALLLSDEGEVDCKPELEIFADDVKCSHGATCGDLDKEQLFYMQSRGICLEDARKILIEAYLQEVLNKIDNPEIAAWISKNL